MDHWTIVLLVLAGYVAVMSLVRLMIRRQNQLLEQFHARMEASKKRKAEEEKSSRRRRVA